MSAIFVPEQKVYAGMAWYDEHVILPILDRPRGAALLKWYPAARKRFLGLRLRDEVVCPRYRPMTMPPVIAAMFHTTLGGDERLESFWMLVASSEHLETPIGILGTIVACAAQRTAQWPAALFPHFGGHTRLRDEDVFAICLWLAAAHGQGCSAASVLGHSYYERHEPLGAIEAYWPFFDEALMALVAQRYAEV